MERPNCGGHFVVNSLGQPDLCGPKESIRQAASGTGSAFGTADMSMSTQTLPPVSELTKQLKSSKSIFVNR